MRRALIVEDEAMIAMFLEDLVDEFGFEATTCASTQHAIYELSRTEFSFAILDVNLGVEVSYPVADLLIARRVPFAFATGYGASGVRRTYASATVLHKPFDKEQLKGVIASLISRGDPQANGAGLM